MTAESVGGSGSLFLRCHGPRKEDWLSLLNILPIQMPFHYSAIFIDHYWGFFAYIFYFYFQGKSALWSHLLQYQEREEKQEHSAESPGEYLAGDSMSSPSQQMNSAMGGTVQTHETCAGFSVYCAC